MDLPTPVGDQVEVFGAWLDALPVAPRGPAPDADAAERGRALFESPEVGCAACHPSPTFTSPGSHDVGTGDAFQVPSLRAVGARLPVMHDGCAETLRERFTEPSCGGGDAHGRTSDLADAEIDDLVAFLSSL
jgi:cytochrome c peroxidase